MDDVIKSGTMPDGTIIQIEDWSKYVGYNDVYNLAAYPISKYTFPDGFTPKAGERMRVAFWFADNSECETVFAALESGKAKLADYVSRLYEKHYAPALTGVCTDEDAKRIEDYYAPISSKISGINGRK